MATFHSWQISPLRALARDETFAGRLQATTTIRIEDVNDVSQSESGGGPFELLGPGDVARLVSGIISRRHPAPGAIDAEETKAVHVEFNRPDLLDLPWRYSPEIDRPHGTAGRGIRPWIVLVVGATSEVVVTVDGIATISPLVQAAHKLADSWRWAHVHEVDGGRIARILCPVDLNADTYYVAALVPAFVVEMDDAVRDAWPAPGGGSVKLRSYDSWTFRTGAEGDFPQLAARLRPKSLAALGPAFGTAEVLYQRRGPGSPRSTILHTAGALQRPPADPPVTADPLESWVTTEVAALTDAVPTPDGRWVLTAPRYHEAFAADAPLPASGWAANLTRDPRHRGAAGLGAWAAIAWQDRIAAAAAVKAGDLAIARDRIGHLAFGLEASRSLWRRHVSDDPVGRLAVLGPVLGRLPAAGAGTVLDAVAGRTPLLARALWSSAARRALRPGPARSSLAKTGASRLETILEEAAGCPDPAPDPDAIIVGRRVDPANQIAAAKDAIYAAGAADPEFAAMIADRLLRSGHPPPPGLLAAILAALDPGGGREPDRDEAMRLLDSNPPSLETGDLGDLLVKLGTVGGEPRRCLAVNLKKLGGLVGDAVDPTVARPLVVERVLKTLSGIKSIGPIEIQPELDLPLWRFLADHSPDWLLPGVGDLVENDVVGVATNPGFVEAMLVGANHQTLGELRWRNVPIVSRWSPLRKFWHRPGGKFDINPIGGWPATSGIGGPGLLPPDIAFEAVVVFRTTLFRRYPHTVVYLYKAIAPWTPPPDDVPLDGGLKVWPTFTGKIGDDIVFFGFPIKPIDLESHWAVLEEPPSGYRFKTETVAGNVLDAGGNNAAEYAFTAFAPPARVMIGDLLRGA